MAQPAHHSIGSHACIENCSPPRASRGNEAVKIGFSQDLNCEGWRGQITTRVAQN